LTCTTAPMAYLANHCAPRISLTRRRVPRTCREGKHSLWRENKQGIARGRKRALRELTGPKKKKAKLTRRSQGEKSSLKCEGPKSSPHPCRLQLWASGLAAPGTHCHLVTATASNHSPQASTSPGMHYHLAVATATSRFNCSWAQQL
jgi:hypothetical protein